MNKEKLIGLIIKKQTYKDTKPIQNDILRKKDQAVNVSIAAIHQILKDDYNAEAKLYAVRYLKDCFEKGNDLFIARTQQKILPILVKFVKDSENQAAILSYGGSYTKSADLEKFKSLVTSMFTMSYQCIEKWALWIPDSSRGFVKAQREVAKIKKASRRQQFMYFRPQNQEIFRQNCLKNGIKLSQPSPLEKQNISQKSKQVQPQQKPSKQEPPKQIISALSNNPKQKYKSMIKISSILKQTQEKLMKSEYFTPQQLTETQAKFNAAVNEYIEEASQFDEHFLENKIEQFQSMKQGHNKKINPASKIQNKKQSKQQQQQRSQKSKNISPPPQRVQNSPTFQNINTNTDKSLGNSNSNLPEKSVIKSAKIQQPPKELPKIVVIPAKKQPQIPQPNKNQNKSRQSSFIQNSKIKPQSSLLQKQSQRVRFQASSQQEYDNAQDQANYGKKRLLPPTRTQVNNSLSNQMKVNQKQSGQNKKTAKFLPEEEFLPPKIETSSNRAPSQSHKNSIMEENSRKPSQIAEAKAPYSNNLSKNLNTKGQKSQTFASIIKLQPPQQFHTQQSQVPSQIQHQPQLSQSTINHQTQLDRLTKKYQYQTIQLYQKLQRLQKQMSLLKQNQFKTQQLSKLTSNTKQVQELRKKLKQEQQDKKNMNQQINILKEELLKMRKQFQKSREGWKSMQSQDVSYSQNVENDEASHRPSNTSKLSNYKIKKVVPVLNSINNDQPSNTNGDNSQSRLKQQPVLPVQAPVIISPFSARIDEDYINNMTNYQKIGSWLDQKNILTFKLCILGLGQQFYSDENMKIYKMQHFFTENGALFLKITFSYHFKRLQQKTPKIVYKNIAEVDFWTKPISKSNQVYSQETIARLCLIPIKIMKATIHFGDNLNKNITFLLPFLYYNFLQPSQFDPEQFESVIKSKNNQTIKSKVIHLSNSISNTAINMPSIFKGSILSNQYLQMCLREQSDEKVFLTQIELLRNQKAVVRVLPIPYDSQMSAKAKQLVDNLVFLLSA